MKLKLLYTVIVLLLANLNAIAEITPDKRGGSVKGQILDSNTEKAVEFASVALYKSETDEIVKGELTDTDGLFNFDEVKPGKYYLKVDFIGYKTSKTDIFKISRDNKNIDLGSINLDPDVGVLDDVTVTAERTYIENKIDKKVINIGKDLLTAGASATEIMSNIPSVDVDIEGNVSLRGNENVRILVDGRPTNLSSEELLSTIPAENIDKVEVITNPSAKYDPDGISGIINIVLKKDKKLGFNGSATAGIGSANEFSGINKYNGSLNLNYNVGKWNLFANYGYRNDTRQSTGDFLRESKASDGTINTLEQNSKNERDRISNSLKTGFDYQFSKKDNISYTANIRKSNSDRRNDMEYTFPNDTRNTTSTNLSNSISHDIVYKHIFSEYSNLELNAYRSDSKSDNESLFKSANNGIENPDENDINNGDNDITSFQADYTNDNDDYKLEYGLKTQFRTIDSDYKYYTSIGLDPRSNHYIYKEQIYSGYANYGKSWDKWSMQAGLRIEKAYTESDLVGGENHKNDYFNFFPSAYLTRKFNETNELGFSFSRRVSRPSTYQLNPAPRFVDDKNIRQGNPYLTPEFTNSYEVSYNKYWKGGSFNTAVFYRNTTDKIQRVKLVDEHGVSNTTYQNISASKEYGLEASVMTKLYKWWSINGSFNVYYMDLITDDTNFSNNGVNWFARLNNNFKASDKLSFQLSGRYMGKRVIAQGHIDPMYGVEMGAKYSILNKKGAIGFRLSDMFNSYKLTYYTSGDNFEEIGNRKWESRVAYLTFTYKFGTSNKKKRSSKRRSEGSGGGMDSSF